MIDFMIMIDFMRKLVGDIWLFSSIRLCLDDLRYDNVSCFAVGWIPCNKTRTLR